MVKFFGHKKRKPSQGSVPEAVTVSPLMATEEPKSPPSSDHLARDKEREKRRKEREQQRKKRDERFANSKASEESRTKAKKKSQKPKLSQEEQDAKDANLGGCHKCAQILVKTIHLIDFLIGLTFVVYGSLIMTNFENPAMEAVITSLTFGSTMMFTTIMGVIGFTTKVCKRVGLAISAYMAPLIAFFYMFAIILLISSPDAFFDYLTEHKDVLYLNEAEILLLENMLPLFYMILAVLAAIEICRFMMLRKIRHTLLRFDAASERIISSHASEHSSNRSKDGSNRTNLSEPLLSDEEV